jgi:hypothetical protein
MELEGSYRAQKSPPLVSILSRISIGNVLPPDLLKAHFNIILSNA